MRIGLIPLDERPVNIRYPAMIAQIAGVELLQPQRDILSFIRTPAQSDQLIAWLRKEAKGLDVLIVSFEMLAFGGLIASRTTEDSSDQILLRLNALREIKRECPSLVVYAFDLITRISRSDNNFEEPQYWETFGSRIYQYSQLLDQDRQGLDVGDQIEVLQGQIPVEHIQDFMARRLRNHIVNLAALELLNDGVLDLLVLSSDDTSPYGIGSREKRWLSELAERTLLGGDRLLMYPGADEVGCALLARALNEHRDSLPTFAIRYAVPGDEEIIAPFEDGPVRTTVERQVRAVGGKIVTDISEADYVVAVNTPSNRQPPFLVATDEEHEARRPIIEPFARDVGRWVDEGKRVIVADVTYPNGADPALVQLLCQHVTLDRLAAYGSWNTAGNTIGTALAQGIASSMVQSDDQKVARSRFLAHRFVEDWGYQLRVRRELIRWLQDEFNSSDIRPSNIESATAMIEEKLQACLPELPGFADLWRITPGSTRFPWERTFEVDFELEQV